MKRDRDFVERPDLQDWASHEFEQVTLGDRRLDKRLAIMAADFAEHPGAPIAQASGSRTKTQRAYEFLENDSVEAASILKGHRLATLGRLSREPVILVPSDTTSFNFSHLHQTPGLGPLGSRAQSKAQGLWLHSTQAFTPTGLPLGFVAAQFWSRPKDVVDKRNREQKPFEEKESLRWRQSWEACQKLRAQLPAWTLLVNIDDMEGDIYEVFAAAVAQAGPRAELLIRSGSDRKLQEPEEAQMWELVARQPPAGTLEVRVPRQDKQPARTATLQIRFSRVWVKAPKRKAKSPPLELWSIEAREEHPPQGVEPILWRLLSTLAVTTPAEAIEKVRWYSVRWSIEVFHKIVKSVCRAEAHQLERVPRLERMLMIDLVVAWRIQVLTQVGRQNPNLPATDYFAQSEWKALYSYIHRSSPLPAQEPDLGEMLHWIGQLGGFVQCKACPHPGPITLGRGLARLNDLTTMWEIQNTENAKTP